MSRTGLQLFFGLVALSLMEPCAAWPHEIGTTQVDFVIEAGHRWSASITSAPTVLVNRLEVEAGEPPSRSLTAETVRERLRGFGQRLADHIEVRFDGVASPATTTIATVEMPADVRLPAFVVVRAGGAIPAQANAVSWRYGLVSSTYAVIFSNETGSSETQWLDADAQSRPFPVATGVPSPTTLQIGRQYLQLGFLHIVPRGLDHILFVLGIFLLTTNLRSILVQVTAFTVAHSVTLALTMYGIISLAPRIVEPLIALSVAYVAIENIVTFRLTPWRPTIVFCFGLLHGMGFAGILAELSLPRSQIIPGLISFNIGIELGQLAVIGAAFMTVSVWFRYRPWYRSRIVIPASAVTACVGLFWTVERVLAV